NGLLLQTGIDYHIRKSKTHEVMFRSLSIESDPIEKMFGTKRSFAPFIRVSWTPVQYYRYEGRQKIYARSDYPTFKVEFSRSLLDVLGSTSQHNRIELDISQKIDFGLMH